MHFNAGHNWYFEERKFRMQRVIGDDPSQQQGSSGFACWCSGAFPDACVLLLARCRMAQAAPAAWSSGGAGGEGLSSLAWTCGDCGDTGRGSFLPGGVQSGRVGKGECHLLLLSTRTNTSHHVHGAVFWTAGSRMRNQTAFPNTLKFVTLKFVTVSCFFSWEGVFCCHTPAVWLGSREMAPMLSHMTFWLPWSTWLTISTCFLEENLCSVSVLRTRMS